jgi:hypothetical protein
MHIAEHCAIGERNEGLTNEHVAQADAKKQSILIEAAGTQCGDVKRIGYKGVCEHGYRRVDLVRRISLNVDPHCCFGQRPQSIALRPAKPDGLLGPRGY